MPANTFKIATLGCKVNQYESDTFRRKLLQLGLAEVGTFTPADLCIINTCTVTAKADAKSRNLIRRLSRENPEATIVATGCYAEKNRGEIEALGVVDLVFGQNDKDLLVQRLEEAGEVSCTQHAPGWTAPRVPTRQARAFLKVQDGCNQRCSYCKVVIVRGRSRSRPLDEIIAEARQLVREGFREIVLTGIQLGSYGFGSTPSVRLSDLVEQLDRIPELARIRLSSIEPNQVTDELLDWMARSDKACPHLHLPLQSGSDTVLRRMRRPYRGEQYQNLVERARARIPMLALSADVMVGFPGETEQDFEQTIRVLDTVTPVKLHLFPYSDRPGTDAIGLDGHVTAADQTSRMERLEQWGWVWARRYHELFLGQTVSVLIEEVSGGSSPGRAIGHTPHYLKVHLDAAGAVPGKIVDVNLLTYSFDGCYGKSADLQISQACGTLPPN